MPLVELNGFLEREGLDVVPMSKVLGKDAGARLLLLCDLVLIALSLVLDVAFFVGVVGAIRADNSEVVAL